MDVHPVWMCIQFAKIRIKTDLSEKCYLLYNKLVRKGVIGEKNTVVKKFAHLGWLLRRAAACLAAMLLTTVTLAQTNVHIVGTSANAAGKTIGLYCYEDMLTCREVLLDNVQIDSTGAFRLGCYVNYPRLVFLQVENYSQSFYIEAGHRYEVYIPDFDWEIDERQNVHLQPVALPVEFIGVANNELNLQISRFDAIVDSFVHRNVILTV